MIWTILQLNVRRLLHNRVELLLMFVVPIAFFSIFAIIFGGGVKRGDAQMIKVLACSTNDNGQSRQIIQLLKENPGLKFVKQDLEHSMTAAEAAQFIREGDAAVAIVIHPDAGDLKFELLADSSDQVATQVVSAWLTGAIMEMQTAMLPFALPGALSGASPGGSTRAGESKGNQTALRSAGFRSASSSTPSPSSEPASPSASSLPTEQLQEKVRIVDVMGSDKKNPVVSMYAAGIAVMFLLFGATGGGGALLEEKESQTLDRLLSTQLTMDQLLLGKWFYLTAIGVVQVTVMFLWGQLIFDVDLFGHFDGFLIMTVVTALAASAFGLFLATLCKTRGQLNGLSVILVLTMSAMGGSMVPRYLMSDRLQEFGLFTFNAWALDGYNKVFWRDLPVASLAPQLAVLLVSGTVMLVAARILAVRWETT